MNYTEGQQMKPEKMSKKTLSVTQAKGKMLEYNIPDEYQNIDFTIKPEKLFYLTIGLLGDYSNMLNRIGETSSDELLEAKNNLRFSSRFFDSYIQSELDHELDSYLTLLGASAYYLYDLPGHSLVLLSKLTDEPNIFNANELDKLLYWLLKRGVFIEYKGIYKENLQKLSGLFGNFIRNGENETEIIGYLTNLRKIIYDGGFPSVL